MMNDLQDLLEIIQDRNIHLVTPRGLMTEADGGLYNAILNQTAPREAPTGGADMANIEKEYLGSAGADKYFYLAKKTDAGGGVQDLLVLDAEDKELVSATSLNVDPQNIKEFVKYAVKKLDITMLSFDIVEKYFFTPEQKGEIKHEAPDKDRKGPDQTGAEHSDKATGKDMAGASGGAEEESPNSTGEVARESKLHVGKFLKEMIDIDPQLLITAGHNPKNVKYVWYYDDASKKVIGSSKSTSHDDKEFATISSKDDAVRGRVFEYDGKTFMIIYGLIASSKAPNDEQVRDIYLKVSDEYVGTIDYVVDERGNDLSELTESKVSESNIDLDARSAIKKVAMDIYQKYGDTGMGDILGMLATNAQGIAVSNLKKEFGDDSIREGKITEAKFDIGEVVYYKGKKWEIADHLKGTYALWSPGDHKEELGGWIPEDQLAKVSETTVKEGRGEELYDRVLARAKKLISDDMNKYHTYHEDNIRDRLIIEFDIERHEAEDIIYDVVKQMGIGDTPAFEARINEGGSGNKVNDFKADDYGLMSVFGMKDIVLVRVLPWPSDEDTISGEDRKAKTMKGRTQQDPDAPVQIYFGLPPVHKSRGLYVEAVAMFGFGSAYEEEYYGPETKHFVNPDNVYKNVSQMEQAHKYLYPEVLKDLSTKLRTSPFGKKLGEFGLAEDVKTVVKDGVTYEPTGQPADVKGALDVYKKSKMHHKMHDPSSVTEDIDVEVTQAGPAFKDYVMKVYKHPWHQLSDETLRQALEDYKKEGATTERKIMEAGSELQVPKSKAQKIFKKLIDQEIVDIKRDTEEDDALGMDQYAFHDDKTISTDSLLYDVLKGDAEYGFGKEFMVKLNNALNQAGYYLEYNGAGVWAFAKGAWEKQDVADPYIAYKTQGAEKHPVFDDKKGTRHGDNEMVEGETNLMGPGGSGTVAGTPSKTYYTVTPIPGSNNWEVMKHWFDQDGRKNDVLKADLKSKEDAIRYAINAGAKEDDVLVNEAKFGSVEWQDEMIANIKGELEKGIPLSGADRAFMETQLDHNKRLEIEELERTWQASESKKGTSK